MLFAVSLAPLYSTAETLVRLVRPGNEYIKIHILHNPVHILIDHNIIHISDRSYQLHPFFRRI